MPAIAMRLSDAPADSAARAVHKRGMDERGSGIMKRERKKFNLEDVIKMFSVKRRKEIDGGVCALARHAPQTRRSH